MKLVRPSRLLRIASLRLQLAALRIAIALIGEEPSEAVAHLSFLLLVVAACGWCVGLGGRP